MSDEPELGGVGESEDPISGSRRSRFALGHQRQHDCDHKEAKHANEPDRPAARRLS